MIQIEEMKIYILNTTRFYHEDFEEYPGAWFSRPVDFEEIRERLGVQSEEEIEIEDYYQVTYTVEQRITEGESGKTVRSAYQVTVYVDGSGNLTIIQNPTITSIPVKSGYTPKAVQSDGTVDSITTEEINEFLTTFFKLYPTATAKELTYYVNEGVLKPVGKEYIFSELVNPVYNRNGNQVTASLAVKYLDNQTMTTQVSQFNLVLEKNGENWKIVK